MPLLPGTILGQYEIRASIGAGGMGEVYRAHDTRLDREVAIKVLPEAVTSDPDRLRRFEQEARAAAALNHPNILAVYQMSTHQGGISYLVTELLEGENLRDRLRRGPLPLRKALDYAVQIARGLAAPHEKGIVHRDLKPENLFVTKDDRVKILDFGLAKVPNAMAALPAEPTLSHGTDPGTVVGTVGYMAPEQVRGKTIDHRSDIFAFGNILYEMLTGRQTFRKPTSAETMTAILNEDPPPISQIAPATPPGLQRVVHRCLEKNPDQRFQSASDLAFALESLSDSAIISPSGVHGQKDHGSKRTWLVALVTAVLVLGAAAVAYFAIQPAKPPRVSHYVQLTQDGQSKQIIGSDGSRLYLYLNGTDYQGLAEVSVSGGEVKKLDILPPRNMDVLSLSHDGTELLAADAQGVPPKGPLWSVPVLGGSLRRVGDMEVSDAIWSPDKKMLAYSVANSLFVAKGDGTESRQVATVKTAYISNMAWSPDGTYLRFTAGDRGVNAIWEVSTDATNLHRLITIGSDSSTSACCGTWTADGKYYVYQSEGQIWELPTSGGFLRGKPKPGQLTSSPLLLSNPVPDKDGKKLFVIGYTRRGQLLRYDAKSRQFEPYLGGVSGEFVAFSKDGQWVAYVSFPDGTLWRSKVDGTSALQLTSPPDYVLLPRWSPDGTKILFFAVNGSNSPKAYEVPIDGGSPEPLMPNDPGVQADPNWSPDGSKVIFSGGAADASSSIRILDLTTHQITTLPGSQGMFSPRYSPDGKYIAALSYDSTRLLLFDSATQQWRELCKGTLGWLKWSNDGQSLLALDQTGAGAVLKIRASDGKMDRLLDLKELRLTGRFGLSLSFAADDSPLLLRNTGTHDVYSLDWQEP